MIDPIKILGICGSIRANSFNLTTLTTAAESAPDGVTIDIFSRMPEIPPFNQDMEADPPEVVKGLKKHIHQCDAILIATPEYNYSLPGVLKNALDWTSRPLSQNPWDGKLAAIMGASESAIGTARAQSHLRQIFVYLNVITFPQPEVIIADADDKFDEAGHLIDGQTRQQIQALVEILVYWIKLFRNQP